MNIVRNVLWVLPAWILLTTADVAFSQSTTQTASPPGGIFSSKIMAGDLLYLAGKGSRDPKTGKHPEGIEAQVRQALENCGTSLKEAGMDFSDVVNANVYITDISFYQPMNKVYKTYFPKNPPARTTVAVPALPGDSQVEITFIATRNAKREYIYPEGVTVSPDDLYSPGVLVGDLLYLSGQGSLDYKTKQFPPGGFEAHVKQTMDNINAILQAAGMDFSNVVKSNVYLKEMANFQKMNEVYKTYFKSNPPARTTVGVSALPFEIPIEITFIASKGGADARKAVTLEGSQPNPLFSPAVMVGDTLFLSGKAGFAEGGIEAQVKEVMDGLGDVLKAANMSFSDVVEGKVYLADIGDYREVNQIYYTYFNIPRPARTCVAVQDLVRNSQIEVTLVAVKGLK